MASFIIKEINLPVSCHDPTKAFTLPELLFVLIIMAILATLAIAIWPGKQINLNAQSQQLLSDMRYIRNYAMTHDEQYRLYFNTGRRQIALRDRAGHCIHYPITGGCQVTLPSQINMATLGMPNGYIACQKSFVQNIDYPN